MSYIAATITKSCRRNSLSSTASITLGSIFFYFYFDFHMTHCIATANTYQGNNHKNRMPKVVKRKVTTANRVRYRRVVQEDEVSSDTDDVAYCSEGGWRRKKTMEEKRRRMDRRRRRRKLLRPTFDDFNTSTELQSWLKRDATPTYIVKHALHIFLIKENLRAVNVYMHQHKLDYDPNMPPHLREICGRETAATEHMMTYIGI